MATRFYIPQDQAFDPLPDAFTPTVQGSWGSDFANKYLLAATAYVVDDTSLFLLRSIGSAASAGTYVHGIAYSRPMQTTHTWDNTLGCQLVLACSEEFTTMNAFTQWSLSIISNDGANVRWTTGMMKDGTEMTTTVVSRNNNSGYTPSPASYTSVPGDRIFIEWGYDKDAAVAGALKSRFGYQSSAADLSTTDGDSGTDNPWMEISHTVTFDAEGTTYSTGVPNGLMMRGTGT